jgi:Uma2 family endonuclease
MTSAVLPAPAPPATRRLAAQQLPLRRFSVDEYHKLLEVGILQSGDPVELLDGYLVLKMSRHPPHDGARAALLRRLLRLVPDTFTLRPQSAVTTADSEPEPDYAIVRGDDRSWFGRHPGPADMALVIEVSDTSLDRDRDVKGPLYVRARIPIYWIVNLNERQIEVYTDPSGPGDNEGYGQRQDYGENDAVALVLDGVAVGTIPVRDVLP